MKTQLSQKFEKRTPAKRSGNFLGGFAHGFGGAFLFASGEIAPPDIALSDDAIRSDWETVGSYLVSACKSYRK